MPKRGRTHEERVGHGPLRIKPHRGGRAIQSHDELTSPPTPQPGREQLHGERDWIAVGHRVKPGAPWIFDKIQQVRGTKPYPFAPLREPGAFQRDPHVGPHARRPRVTHRDGHPPRTVPTRGPGVETGFLLLTPPSEAADQLVPAALIARQLTGRGHAVQRDPRGPGGDAEHVTPAHEISPRRSGRTTAEQQAGHDRTRRKGPFGGLVCRVVVFRFVT